MEMNDSDFSTQLRSYVLNNSQLVVLKPTPNPKLSILKYTRKAFYESAFNSFLEECRGTVVDQDFRPVSYPFTKIFNYGLEKRAPVLEPDTTIIAYRKVNGFMAAMRWYDSQILISTTGTIDSQFVTYIREMMDLYGYHKFEQLLSQNPDHTYLFECVHPKDPHIVVEEHGLHYIGRRLCKWGSIVDGFSQSFQLDIDDVASQLGTPKVGYIRTTIGSLLSTVKATTDEGYVFYTEDGRSSKLKSPHYLISKYYARANSDSKLMGSNAKSHYDEEYYPLIDAVASNLSSFRVLTEQQRLVWIRNFLTSGTITAFGGDLRPVCYFLVGLPGVGKSLWSQNQKTGDTVIISTDNYIESWSLELGTTYDRLFESAIDTASDMMTRDVKDAVWKRSTIIWDQTNLTKNSRKRKLQFLKGYRVICVHFLPVPEEVLFSRLDSREGKTIDSETLMKMISSYQRPTKDEGFDEVWEIGFEPKNVNKE